MSHSVRTQEAAIPRIPVNERRARLVAAAFEVVARDGVHAATTRAICAQASMSLASFHYAFSSRDELLRALVVAGLSSEDTAVHAVIAAPTTSPTTSLESVLHGGLTGYLHSVVDNPDREQAMLALAAYARRTPELDGFAADMYHRYYSLAAQFLSAAADTVGSQWRTDPRELAPLVVAATDGLTLAYLNTGDISVARSIITTCVSWLLTHAEQP